MTGIGPYVAFTAVAVAALLASHYFEWPPGIGVSKTLASAAFVATALALGATRTPYGRLVLLALVLSFAGDVLLVPAGASRAFVAGMASFALAHAAYAAAFAVRGMAAPVFLGCAGLVIAALAGALPRLAPHLPRRLRVPVAVYVAAIGMMLSAAVATSLARPSVTIPLGAGLFAASDAFVARHRFVSASFSNKAFGLPMYYGAQLLLALSVALPVP